MYEIQQYKDVYSHEPHHYAGKTKDLSWDDVKRFILFRFPDTEKKIKYEFLLFNPRWFQCLKSWQYSTAKKIDVVVESPAGNFLIETDPYLRDETLGQLLTYKYWYERQEQKTCKIIAVCKEVQEMTANLLLISGAEIYRITETEIKQYTKII